MKRLKSVIVLLMATSMLVLLCSCGNKMSEEEVEATCKKEAENFVGGYLSCTSLNYLEKYKADPWYDYLMDNNMYNFKPRPNYIGTHECFEVPERIADYILTHASFKIDPYSFVYEKKRDTALLSVSVTIIPPQTAFDTIEDYVTTCWYLMRNIDTAAIDAVYYESLSLVEGISPVTQSVNITFKNEDGEWLIDNWSGVAQQINEIR